MTPAERRALIDEYYRLAGTATGTAARRRIALRETYEAELPRIAFSRCPFTGEAFSHSVDVVDLDGPWWDYDLPVRAVDEQRPDTFFALTGSVRLNGSPTRAPFTCRPGPEVPFVVPRMLLHPDVRAVISHLTIGGHDAYPVVYFADPAPPLLERFNDWGTSTYTYDTDTDPDRWHGVEEDARVDELDVDVARWITRGDLQWIAPDDTQLRLRSTADDCPYVGVEGRRTFATIQDGKVDGQAHARSKRAPVKRSRKS